MKPNAPREDGFTLLEILMAMIVLAVGGVSILSLFTAAVSLQYKSVISGRKAVILTDVVAEAQQVINAHTPTKEQPLPPKIERKPVPAYPDDFEVEVSFEGTGRFPSGEGAIARITLYYEGRALDPIVRVIQKTVFAKAEIEKSVSYEEEHSAEAQAKDKAEEKGPR